MTRPEPISSRPRNHLGRLGRIRRLALRFLKDDSGGTAIEYGLISGLLFLAIVGALRYFADRTGGMYAYINSAVSKGP